MNSPSLAPGGSAPVPLGFSRFETELNVRPDDIDMYQHVHGSRYFDYVLAARFDQMARCYGMSMEDFAKRGLGWFARTAHIEYRRALRMGDSFVVRTWIDEIVADGVRVQFEIDRRPIGKRICDGWFQYTLISLANGRATRIPEDVAVRYAI